MVDKVNAGNRPLTRSHSSITADTSTMRSTIADIMIRLDSLDAKQDSVKLSLENKIDQLSQDLSKCVDTKLKEIKEEFSAEITVLKEECDTLKATVQRIQDHLQAANANAFSDPCNDPDRCVIITNMPVNEQTELKHQIAEIFDEMGPDVSSIEIVATKRLPKRKNQPGLVKVALENLEAKKTVLKSKNKLSQSRFSGIWIRNSMPHIERLIHLNFRQLLKIVPNGSMYRVSGSGRIYLRDHDGDEGNRSQTIAQATNTPSSTQTSNRGRRGGYRGRR